MSEGNAIRVLLVEDDDDDDFLIRAVLARVVTTRYVVRRAAGYDTGLALLAERAHDICLLDYRLGGADGLELLDEALQQGLPGPFVMLTGEASRELDLEAMRRGASDYVVKSGLNPPIIERVIRYGLERARAAAQLTHANTMLEERVRDRTSELEAARKEAERLYLEAQNANRLKDEFLANVSHELRTPLSVIVGYADLLRTHPVAGETRDILETVRRNALAQARLVDDLLDISRIATSKLGLALEPVQVGELFEAAIKARALEAEQRGIRLVLDAKDEAQVLADPLRLEQVISNLVSNALKFTPAGGTVTARLRRADANRVQICVEDTGKGIEAEFLPRVFERFSQADARISRHQGGLGLGLAIARHLVELQGGTIEAQSQGPGKGSTFLVRLPVHGSSISAASTAAAAGNSDDLVLANRQTLRGIRVLVVDDAPDVRALLHKMLANWGADPVTADSVASALREIDRQRPDVLISDIGMPVDDGYALIRALRELERTNRLPRLPAAAMTAFARDEEKCLAIDAGFDLHVSKPVSAAVLVRTAALLAARSVRDGATPRTT